MEINPVIPVPVSDAERSRTTLAADFDNFLTLLTTQLQHQDPLDPLDSNDFVAQLVSFTGVEQAVKSNANLEALIDLFKLSHAASAIDYLGTTIEARGDTTVLADGSAVYLYGLPETAASTGIIITNDQGEVAFTGNGGTSAGDHVFAWDGRDNDGVAQPEGVYKISLSARDVDGNIIPVTTMISGQVTGIETLEGKLVLVVNGIPVPFENVVSIIAGAAQQPPSQ